MMLLTKLDEWIRRIERCALTLLISCMMVLGLMQIVSRFVIQQPIGWSEPMLTYMFVWACFLGASLAVAYRAHFEVELFVDRLSPGVQRLMAIFVQILLIAFSGVMVWKGLVLVEANQTQEMAAMPFSMVWPYLAMPVAGLFTIIHCLCGVGKLVKGEPNKGAVTK